MRLLVRASTALTLVAGLLSAIPASAQMPGTAPSATAPAKPIDPAALKEATSMSDLLNIPQQARNIVQAMRNQAIQATMQSSGKPVDEAAKIVDEVLMPDFDAAVPELTSALIMPWAANFSVADLKGLHDFYSTPLGTRLLKTVPIVSQQSLQGGQAWMQRTFAAAAKKHADELHARGLKF